MKRILIVLTFLVTLSLSAFAQGYVGAGFSSNISRHDQYQGPYLEGGVSLGDNFLGGVYLGHTKADAVLYSEPGARFSVSLYPSYFEQWNAYGNTRFKPYIKLGGEWASLPHRDEWHSVLGVGADLPCGFAVEFQRLHLNPQGYRGLVVYQHALPTGLALKLSGDVAVNRHAADKGRVSVGVVKTF